MRINSLRAALISFIVFGYAVNLDVRLMPAIAWMDLDSSHRPAESLGRAIEASQRFGSWPHPFPTTPRPSACSV